MIRNRGRGAVGEGVAPAEVAPRPHEHVNDGLELIVAEVLDRAGMTRPPQDSDIGGRDVIEMLLVADRCEEFGLVEDAQEFRDFADEVEEGAKPLDLLSRRVAPYRSDRG